MKKWLSMVLVLIIAFSMAACTPVEEAPAVEAPTEEAPVVEAPVVKDVSGMEAMKNVHVRRAIAMAIDKTFIADVILNNGSIAADYLVPSGFVYNSGDDFRDEAPNGFLHFDVEKAQAEWAMAKEELGFETVIVEFLNYDSEGARQVAEYVQGQLTKNLPGIEVTINAQPFKNKLALADERKFEFQYAGWGPDYVDASTFLEIFRSHSGHNSGDYNNEEFTSLVDSAMTGELTLDINARWEAMKVAEEMLLEDAAVIPLYQRSTAAVQRPYVKDVFAQPVGGDYTFKNAESQVVDGEMLLRLLDGSDIPTMDQNKATNSVSFLRLVNMVEGLYTPAEKGIEPGVAESYTVSEDGLVYTFNLRDNAVWENGTPVTANDFVYSWKRLVNPETGSEYAYMADVAGIKNAAAVNGGEVSIDELGVKAIDDSTLEVTLAVPVPYFVELISYFPPFAPVNEAFVEEVGSDNFGTTAETILANGPFKMDKWELGYGDEWVKNDTYWNAETVKLDRITFRIVKDNNTAVNLYEGEEVDRTILTSENVDKFKASPNYFTIEMPVVFYLQFNVQQK